MTAVLAYGFVARVLTGPTLSHLGQFVSRVVTPRPGIAPLPRWPVRPSGSPKRFAQGMGATFSLTALALTILGYWTAADLVLGLLVVATTLGSALGICFGCITLGMLMRTGVVPDEVCERCKNIWATAPRSGAVA